METFTFEYKTVRRELPVFEVSAGMKIAYLDTLSDYELVSALSQDMANLVCENARFQSASRVVLLTAENKGVPFAYMIARILCEKYGAKKADVVVARKHEKKFFGKCVYAEKTSITSERGKDRLLVTEADAEKLKNAEVILVDDFYSTGASVKALGVLACACGAEIVDKIVAIWEVADSARKPDVKYVATLPVL